MVTQLIGRARTEAQAGVTPQHGPEPAVQVSTLTFTLQVEPPVLASGPSEASPLGKGGFPGFLLKG